SKNSYQISAETEQSGVHFEVSPGHDFSSLALYGLTKNLPGIFHLTRDIITAPVFPEQELDQMKAIYNQTMKINLEKTSYLASVELRKKLFGEQHPYGREAALSHVAEIQRAWLTDFHRARFGSFRIICSGNITDTLLTALTDCFETIPLHTETAAEIQAMQTSVSAVFIEKKESVQSSLRLARKVVNRTHADYPALLLLNHIFGGYFGSRLMKNIREEKGLTYGIHSSVSALRHASFVTVGTDVNKENRELALNEIKNEMRELCRNLIGSSELETARNHFIGSLQSEITTPFAHADKIKNLLLFGLPVGYYQQLIVAMDALSARDLMETANQYLNPETFTSVAVG
ncbi:MAG TPA: pitrilysin family protein, partial [Cyclobacteriaceae bacterium]|nr:pitrilysin family protein [Cyclobacteriaceae bacterium]